MTNSAPLTAPDNLTENARVAHFGVFELDLRSGELRRAGVKVKLQEQPFRVLTFLLERPGEVVSRDELRERLWPADFVDFDHSLNTAVRKLRTALDDTADNPRFVETLARRGYRFIAPVTWNDSGAPSGTYAVGAGSPAPAATPKKTRSMVLSAAIAVVVLAAIASVFLLRKPPAPSPSVKAIAVLPFINDDAKTQHVSDGLTEILIDTLSRVPDLRVMARTTVFRYKGQTVDPKKAGADLNVGAIVTGSVQPENNAYRIHVEMIDVRDGSQLWGNQYIAAMATLPDVQNRISDDLSHELRRGVDRAARQNERYSRDAEAYDLYLKGLYAWNQRGPAQMKQALEYFKAAIDRDPTFAKAYAGIANTYGVMVGNGMMLPAEGQPRVIAAARKALELDPYNAEAYVSLATTEFRNQWDFPAAERDYRRGLALNPNYATGHQWYSDYLRSMGRVEESRHEIETAYRLDPFSKPITVVMCFRYFNDRQFEEAIAFTRRVAQTDRSLAPDFCAANAYLALGRYEDAYKALDPPPALISVRDSVFASYRKSGPRGFYEKQLEVLLDSRSGIISRFSNSPIEIAECYSMLGKADEAFAWLEKAYKDRVSRLTNINYDPRFDPIRSDPRYADLLRRIGLPNVPPLPPELKPVS